MTRNDSNGSKWAGQAPDSVEDLVAVLAENPLDPKFEGYGNFAYPLDVPECWDNPEAYKQYSGQVRFFGNFAELSHGFNITSDEPETIRKLIEAIRKNQASAEYQRVRAGYDPCPECGKLAQFCGCEDEKEARAALAGGI